MTVRGPMSESSDFRYINYKLDCSEIPVGFRNPASWLRAACGSLELTVHVQPSCWAPQVFCGL